MLQIISDSRPLRKNKSAFYAYSATVSRLASAQKRRKIAHRAQNVSFVANNVKAGRRAKRSPKGRTAGEKREAAEE